MRTILIVVVSWTLGAIFTMPRRHLVPNQPYALIVQKLTNEDVFLCRHDENCIDINQIN